ncbi:ABC transporter permease [Collinsella provencensis]|uniref:ABC transporter permease n=1 Tax=Collinsella provencensis TaxID=1937461 RepID=UPI000C83F29A|nr:ABC transporter permease [Collinsella provencensis]
MWTTFKITVKTALRTPSVVIWTLLFPIVLATVFNFMFESLRAKDSIDPVPVAVVDDGAWDDSPFSEVIDELVEGDEPLFDVQTAKTEDAARELLLSGAVDGVYMADEAGDPHLLLAPENSSVHTAGDNATYEVNRSIIEVVASSYLQNRALIDRIAAENPLLFTDPEAIEQALTQNVEVNEISLTHSQPDQTVRYYYALLGMASMFAAQVAEGMVCRLQPTTSDLGARRSISGTSRVRLLLSTLAACWLVSTAFLGIALLYICTTGNIDFAGREPICLLGITAASLFSTCLGALIGALPIKGGADARSGILTMLTCLLAVFAGLYGQPTMELADSIAQACPAAMWINPVSLIRDVFYSIYYYDAFEPFALRALMCIALAAVAFAASAVFFRRQSYEHL